MELARIAYHEGRMTTHLAILQVLYHRDTLTIETISSLRAFPSLWELCSRYLRRGECSATLAEILIREDNVNILRGGVRRLTGGARARISRQLIQRDYHAEE